jgi:hypothetical protein
VSTDLEPEKSEDEMVYSEYSTPDKSTACSSIDKTRKNLDNANIEFFKNVKQECTDILKMRFPSTYQQDEKSIKPDEEKDINFNKRRNALSRRTKPPPWMNYNEFKKIRPFNSNKVFNFSVCTRDGRKLRSDKDFI